MYTEMAPYIFYSAALPTLIGLGLAGLDPINGLLWLTKFVFLLLVSFIEKMTLYTYAFVGVHGGRCAPPPPPPQS